MSWWFWPLLRSEEISLYLRHSVFHGGAFRLNDSHCSEQTIVREWSGDDACERGKPAAKVCTGFSEGMDVWMDGWMSFHYQASNQTASQKQLHCSSYLQEKKKARLEKQWWNKLLYAWHSNEPLCSADITFPSIQKWFTCEEKNPFLVKYLDSKQPIFTSLRLRKMLCFWSCNPKGAVNSGQSKDKRLYTSCLCQRDGRISH